MNASLGVALRRRAALGLVPAMVVCSSFGAVVTAKPDGVTNDAILLGHTTGLTGQIAGSMKEQTGAMRAYFDWVNKSGGVHGRKILLKSLDDEFSPQKAGANAKRLIEQEKVFALFMPRGTPHTEAVLTYAVPAGVPVVAPSTGADIFHAPVNRHVFNVRAKYQDEVIAAIRHLKTVAITRIALLHVNDSFGNDGRKGFERGMTLHELKAAKVASYDRVKNNSKDAVPEMLAADPQAVIIVGSTTAVSGFIKEMKARGSAAQFITLSNNASAAFVADLGPEGRGVMMTQVTPAPRTASSRLGQEFEQIAVPAGVAQSYIAMEGFISAKVMVEGLRRAGKDLTRQRFIEAMESIRNHDFGGMVIDYSPTKHTGSTFVEMTMVSERGKFVR